MEVPFPLNPLLFPPLGHWVLKPWTAKILGERRIRYRYQATFLHTALENLSFDFIGFHLISLDFIWSYLIWFDFILFSLGFIWFDLTWFDFHLISFDFTLFHFFHFHIISFHFKADILSRLYLNSKNVVTLQTSCNNAMEHNSVSLMFNTWVHFQMRWSSRNGNTRSKK